MSNSLNKLYRESVERICKISNELPWSNREFYGLWLTQTYHFVRHSTRLVTLASSRLPLDLEGLRRRFVEHAKEEWGHERLAANDLKNLDFDLNHFRELGVTAGFYQSQYYWIEHVNPVAFFGYILLLEGLAIEAGPDIYEQVSRAFSPKSGAFLRLHAAEDVDHIEKALQEISQLNDDEMQLVIHNFRNAVEGYELMLKEIQNEVNIEAAGSAA